MVKTPVLRVLDKETLSEKFRNLSLDVVRFDRDENDSVPALYSRALRHGSRQPDQPALEKRPRFTRPSTRIKNDEE